MATKWLGPISINRLNILDNEMIDVTGCIDKDFTMLLECYNLKVIMDLFLKIFT